MCVAASVSCHPPAACVCECSLFSRAALGQSPGSNPDLLLLTLHKHASDKKDSCIHLGKKRGSTRVSGSRSGSCFIDTKLQIPCCIQPRSAQLQVRAAPLGSAAPARWSRGRAHGKMLCQAEATLSQKSGVCVRR